MIDNQKIIKSMINSANSKGPSCDLPMTKVAQGP